MLILCTGYALTRGGAPERIVGATFALASVLTYLAFAFSPLPFHGVELSVVAIDAAVFAILLAVALRAERFWPMWSTSMVLISLVGHLVMAVSPEVIPWAYAVILSIWSYPTLLILVGATRAHRLRLARHGRDPAWSVFPPS